MASVASPAGHQGPRHRDFEPLHLLLRIVATAVAVSATLAAAVLALAASGEDARQAMTEAAEHRAAASEAGLAVPAVRP